jgi:hypothetical protein
VTSRLSSASPICARTSLYTPITMPADKLATSGLVSADG